MVDNGTIRSTTAGYDMSDWKRFFEGGILAKTPIKSIKPIHIEREYKRICGDGNYTERAFSKAISLLNGIFDEAIVMNLIDVNIARATKVKNLKFKLAEKKYNEYGEVEKDVYTKEEIETLRNYLDTLPATTYTLGIKLATYFCMRLGELRALTWDDYYPDKHQIFIWHEIVKVAKNGKNRSDEDVAHTKGGKEEGRRWVLVPQGAAETLEKLRALNGNKKYILNGSKDARYSIPENKFNEHLRTYCEACGITYRSSHKFRFYGISAMYEAGISEQSIQYSAGHSDPRTTRHYNRSKAAMPTLAQIESILG